MKPNKKVKNATPTEFDGISFKSKFEASAYKLLKESNMNPEYEPDKFYLMEGFKPNVPFYLRNKTTKALENITKKVLAITYSPDIVIHKEDYTFFIELKGMKTDSYNIKVKLFRKLLEGYPNSIFFELHSLKEVREAIEIIKGYGGNTGINKDTSP